MPNFTDATATVAQLKARLADFVRERDWEQFHAPKNLSMALAAEAGGGEIVLGEFADSAFERLAGEASAVDAAEDSGLGRADIVAV